MGSCDLSVVVPTACVAVPSAGIVVAPVEGDGSVFTTLGDGRLVRVGGIIGMGSAEHGAHQAPFAGEVTLNLNAFGFGNHAVDHNELCDLALALLIILSTSGSFPAAELNSLGTVVGVMGTIAVNSAHLTIQPAIGPILVTHGGLVEVPVIIILRNTVIGVVNPAVKMANAVVVLTTWTEKPIPVIRISDNLLTVGTGVAHYPKHRKFCCMIIETIGVVGLPKNVFLVVASGVIEIDYSKPIEGVGNETRIGLHSIEMSCVS